MFKFRPKYLLLTILLFCIEVLIAAFLHDPYIRPYVGDYLVVILIYCFLRAFFNLSINKTAVIVLLFSYVIEILQYFKLVNLLELENFQLARIVLGVSFEWIDLVAYTLGVVTILIFEKLRLSKSLREDKSPQRVRI